MLSIFIFLFQYNFFFMSISNFQLYVWKKKLKTEKQ